jgi:uncharacterized membrane protein
MNITFLYKFLASVVVIALVDLIWLTTGGPYAVRIAESIQGSKITLNKSYAFVVYFFLAYMLMKATTYIDAFLFGICIYGVYDFTTLAIFNKYDYRFAFADTLWGGILFVLSKYIMSILSRMLKLFLAR